MSKDSLDNVVLGQIMAGLINDSTVGRRSDHTPCPRQRSNHHGHRICKTTFLQLHGIGKCVLLNSSHK